MKSVGRFPSDEWNGICLWVVLRSFVLQTLKGNIVVPLHGLPKNGNLVVDMFSPNQVNLLCEISSDNSQKCCIYFNSNTFGAIVII